MTKKKKLRSKDTTKDKIQDISLEMKEALSKDAKEKGFAAICAYMHAITGRRWTPTMLYNLTKRERDAMIRADDLAAFTIASGGIEALSVMISYIPGVRLVTEADALRLELLDKQEEIERKQGEIDATIQETERIRHRLEALKNSSNTRHFKYKEL